MFNPAEIAADEAVIAGATEGPWECHNRGDGSGTVKQAPYDVDAPELLDDSRCPYMRGEVRFEDGEFAVAARTRWPLYVAEVKRLKTPVKVSRVSFCASLDSNRGLCACGDFVNGWQKFCPNCGVPLTWEER